MPLYDVTWEPRAIRSSKCARAEALAAFHQKVNGRTFDRAVQTVDEILDEIVAAGAGGKLIWAKTASIVGYQSMGPKKLVDHVWNSVEAVLGDGRPCIFAVGQLIKWRVSVRPETWLVFSRDTRKTDPITGEDISAAEYWVNDQFQLKRKA